MKKPIAVFCLSALLTLILLSPASAGEDRIAGLMASMSLREKVGQLFVVRPDALDSRFSPDDLEDNSITGTTKVTMDMRAVYASYPCGGFAIFRKNILSAPQLLTLTDNLHALGAYRPLIAIDEEGGQIARIANHPAGFGVRKFPAMGDIAASGDEALAHEVGTAIGAYLKAYGIDVDFAPVADVNTNPNNPVIGKRAFGDSPALAARMVTQVVTGLHESGTASCLKHFPGHGDTSTDTHTGYAETFKSWAEMADCEMIPFRAGIEAGSDLVMTAHIAAPNVTGSDEPATMSYVILTEKLRGELGFDGLIITDALSMGAITEKYTSSEACVQCILAGADLLLMPYDYFEAFDGVVKAVEEGVIPESRIDESLRRVLTFKMERMGL
ncbi:MAG: glycoside hydrolase [Clostridia bacterium]|nr:glycoside hydrolase [Clostridia bacterium]